MSTSTAASKKAAAVSNLRHRLRNIIDREMTQIADRYSNAMYWYRAEQVELEIVENETINLPLLSICHLKGKGQQDYRYALRENAENKTEVEFIVHHGQIPVRPLPLKKHLDGLTTTQLGRLALLLRRSRQSSVERVG